MRIDPNSAGLDEARLANIGEHLQSRYIDPAKIAGTQVAIVRGGEIGYFDSLGVADRERNKPVADDTIWRLYSMTKPITGVALMTLYEKGHFQLNDPVDRWIPEWRDMTVKARNADGVEQIVPAHRPPSVKDVMMHMSGIGYGPDNADLELLSTAWMKDLTLETLTQELGQWPLRFQPGTRWLYSLGMDVCARLIEVMSGMAYDEYLKQTIFEPLRMVDTDFFVPEEKFDRFSACYARNANKELVLFDDPEESRYLQRPSLLSGGGGLVGTTGDYLRFVAMLANGGELDGHRILGRKTIELMASNHLPGNRDMSEFAFAGGYGETGFTGTGFGLTVAVSKTPVEQAVSGTAGEFMWGGAASTAFWVDPAEQLGVVFMTQLMPSGTFNFRGQLKSMIYGALL